MDNQRLLIWAFFGLMGWITYQTWVQDYAPKPVATTTTEALQPELATRSEGGDLPELSAPTDVELDAPAPAEQAAIEAVASTSSIVPTM